MALSMASGAFEKIQNESSSNGNNQQNKTVVIKEMARLNLHLKNLEKEKTSQLYNRKSGHREVFMVLEESDQRYTDTLKQEFKRLYHQVTKVKSMVVRFKVELDNLRATPEFVEHLKQIMEEIETSISQFKEQQRLKYDELLHEESTLLTEITVLEGKFDSWSAAPGADPEPQASGRAPLTSARNVNKRLPPEVAAFDKFVRQNGGVRGGWDEYDHATFLKLLAKFKNPTTFKQEAIHSLPTRTEEQLKEHMNWYEEFLLMQDVKKQAIAKWKEEKNAEKDTKLTTIHKHQEDEKRGEKQKAEEKQRRFEEEKLLNQERLQIWKKEQIKKRQMEEAKKNLEEEKKQQQQDAKRRKHLALQKQVLEFKQKRLEHQESRALQEEARLQAEDEARRRQVAERAAHIQQRSRHMLEARQATVQARRQADADKQVRLDKLRSQVAVVASSDPSRVLRPTQGWTERQRQSEGQGTGRVYTMPHRGTPVWRQGMHS